MALAREAASRCNLGNTAFVAQTVFGCINFPHRDPLVRRRAARGPEHPVKVELRKPDFRRKITEPYGGTEVGVDPLIDTPQLMRCETALKCFTAFR